MTLPTTFKTQIQLSKTLLKSNNPDKLWAHFTQIFLQLKILATEIKENEEKYLAGGCPILSIGDHDHIKLCFQNMVVFLVYPNLFEGFSIPLKMRSKAYLDKTAVSKSESMTAERRQMKDILELQKQEPPPKPTSGEKKEHFLKRSQKLDFIYDILLEWSQLHETRQLIFSNFNVDMLSILIQNIFIAPGIVLNPADDRTTSTGQKLQEFIDKTAPNDLVGPTLQLLHLQNGSPFVKNICGKILSELIAKKNQRNGYPDGLVAVIQAVIGDLKVKDYNTAEVWTAIRRLGLLLSIPPKNAKNSNPEKYFTMIIENLAMTIEIDNCDNYIIYCRVFHSFCNYCLRSNSKNSKYFADSLENLEPQLSISQLHGLLFVARAPQSNLYDLFSKIYYKNVLEKWVECGPIEVENKWCLQLLHVFHDFSTENDVIFTRLCGILLDTDTVYFDKIVEILTESKSNVKFIAKIFVAIFQKMTDNSLSAEAVKFQSLFTEFLSAFDPSELLLNDADLILDFSQRILTEFEGEETTLRLILAVLSILASSLAELTKNQKVKMRNLVPILQNLLANSKNFSVHLKELLSDTCVALATFSGSSGLASLEDQLSKLEIIPEIEQDHPAKRKEEELPGNRVENQKQKGENNVKGIFSIDEAFELLESESMVATTKKTKKKQNSNNKAMSIAMQAGAIRSLTRHIKEKSLSTNQLLKAEKYFSKCLSSDDSFLYLSAIQGLAHIPNFDIEILAEKLKFSPKTQNKSQNQNQNAKDSYIMKLKIVEVIIRIVDKRAVFTPSILNMLLNIINATPETEFKTCPDVIASSVICLAKIFIKLGPSAGTEINKQEVFNMLINITAGEHLPVIIRHAGINGLSEILEDFSGNEEVGTLKNFLEYLTPELALKLLKFLKLMTHSEDEIVAIWGLN